MCKTFYKYFLITATSFFACGGLYLVCLTDFLWPDPKNVHLREKYDWRQVSFVTGFLGLLIFTPGLVVVIRARARELKYYGIFLLLPFAVTVALLLIRLAVHEDRLETTNWYLLGLALGTLAIIINVFLFRHELVIYGHHQLLAGAQYPPENSV